MGLKADKVVNFRADQVNFRDKARPAVNFPGAMMALVPILVLVKEKTIGNKESFLRK